MITLKLSSPTSSPEGIAVKLILSSADILSFVPHTGVAFSGAKHTLVVKGTELELISWLEIAEDYFGDEVKIITQKTITLIKNRKIDTIDFWA